MSRSPGAEGRPSRSPFGPLLAALLVAPLWAVAAGLDDPVRSSWKAVPLDDWAARVASLAGMPVIVDRRLDPQTPVTAEGRGEPLREMIATVAAGFDGEVALLRSTIRIVPRGRGGLCERAEDARDREIARLPATPRQALLQQAAWSWPMAARPRDLVATLAHEAGVALEGIEDLPHDHFPAADLPAMTRAERLDLVLAHFDRRVRWRTVAGAARGTIVPLDTDLPPPRRRIVPAQRPPLGRQPAREVYALRVAAPLDETLAAVAGRCGLRLEIDRGSLQARGVSDREIVRLDVRDATRERLLDEILTPLGLAWKIDDGRLTVFAPAPAPE